MACDLCKREVERLTIHHLIPKEEEGHRGPTISICSACHRQIHTLFDNKVLAEQLNSLDKLLSEPQMAKFISWVKKQDPQKRVRVHRKKSS